MSKSAMLKDLKRSGLTDADAKKLGLRVLSPKQNDDITGFSVAAYYIPYHDLDGKPVEDFYRVRHLEEIPGKFGSKRKKAVRYTGPSNTLPRLYLPTSFDWAAIAADVDVPIVFTEGEKKAAKACKHGVPTISVPGVWAWRSKKQGVPLIDDFSLIDWSERQVLMCFDNDVMTNPLVIGALNALAHQLVKLGAEVSVIHLPKGKLKGLDDFIRAKSADALFKLPITPFNESQKLWAFNEQIAYIKVGNYFLDLIDGVTYPDTSKLKQAYGNLSYEVPKADGDGMKTVYVPDEWIRWPYRRHYRRQVYSPGAGQVVGEDINSWQGWGCEPEKGNVKPFLDLLNYIFEGEPDIQQWFLQWLAYPLQFPGTKLLTAVLFWSQEQGIGKTFVGEIMRGIYGENFSMIDKEDIVGEWNDWLVNKQFIAGEEITGGDSRHVADKVKNMITRTTVKSKIKFQATFDLADRANYLLTSNHEDSLHLQPGERRFLVHHIDKPKASDEFYAKIERWRLAGGASFLFHHLLQVNVKDFNPKAAAPETASKREMQDLSKSSLQMQIEQLIEFPDECLRLGQTKLKRDVYKLSEVLAFLDGNMNSANMLNPAARILTKLRVPKLKTRQGRYVALRNLEKWRKAEGIEWQDNYEIDFKGAKYEKAKRKRN